MKKIIAIIILIVLITSACTNYSPVSDTSFNQDIKHRLREYEEVTSFEVLSGPLFLGISINLNGELDKDEVFLKLIPMLSDYELINFVNKKYRKYGEPNIKITFIKDKKSYMYFNKYEENIDLDYLIWEYRTSNDSDLYRYTIDEEKTKILKVKVDLNE